MELIDVTVRFKQDGRITPIAFTWNGTLYRIESTGRRWEDALGHHFLVMIPGGKVFDLIYQPAEGLWRLRQIGPNRAAA